MSRLRYPFTEISARCRLCGAVGFTASSEHALGGRLIDWRREHARVCPEWPRWAQRKGLRLDENGALLYGSEVGPYQPRGGRTPDDRGENEGGDEEDQRLSASAAVDLMQVPADELEQTSFL